MNLSRTLMIAAVTAVAAAPTQSAFAGRHAAPATSSAAGTFRMIGEPKNAPPFTNHVDPRGTAGVPAAAATTFRMVGEPKNEPPFTNRVVEPKATRELARTSRVDEFHLMWRANAMTTSYALARAPDSLDRYLRNNGR